MMRKTTYVIITENPKPNPCRTYIVRISRFFLSVSGTQRSSASEYHVSEERARMIQGILESHHNLVIELDGGTIKLIGSIRYRK